MSLVTKLQLKSAARVALLGPPGPVLELEGCAAVPGGEAADADAVFAFVLQSADIDEQLTATLTEAADADKLVWVAYPKAGQLGTDLNRDRLAAAMTERGLRPVRQIAVDGVWSALRFRR